MAAHHGNPIERFAKLLLAEKEEIKSIYFYAILSGLLQLSVPIGIQSIIGFVMGATMVTSIYVLIVLVVFGVVMVGVFQINQMKIIEKIQQQIFTRYAFDFAEKIPRFDLKKVDGLYLPEIINRFFDTLNLQKGLSKLLLDIPTATIQILFGLVLLSLYHPAFIVFGFLLILVLWLILRYTSRKGMATSYKESSYKYAVVAWLEEMARVIKSFKFSQGSHLNLYRTDKNVVGYLQARTEHFGVLVFQYRTLVVFKVAITATMLVVGTFLLIDQQLNVGEFIAAEIVILTVIGAVEKLISSLDSAYDVMTGLEKLASVTELPLETEGHTPFVATEKGVSIDIRDVEFQHADGTQVLNRASASIPAGRLVQLSGEAGAGKSSFLKILSGSYSDFKGGVLLNNLPIGSYALESLRSHTGVYLHRQDIFVGTILENIGMGRGHITPQKIMTVATAMGIGDFLQTFPQGFETELDPMGKKLASSILKKILLLRACVHEPNLLLLEEPWQGLSPEEKKSIIGYLLNLKHTTTIVATNSQSFGDVQPLHLVLENGKIKTT